MKIWIPNNFWNIFQFIVVKVKKLWTRIEGTKSQNLLRKSSKMSFLFFQSYFWMEFSRLKWKLKEFFERQIQYLEYIDQWQKIDHFTEECSVSKKNRWTKRSKNDKYLALEFVWMNLKLFVWTVRFRHMLCTSSWKAFLDFVFDCFFTQY